APCREPPRCADSANSSTPTRVPGSCGHENTPGAEGPLASLPLPPPKPRQSVLLILLSLIRATSLPGSAPQALGHAVAPDHALLPSRDGRFVARGSAGLILPLPFVLRVIHAPRTPPQLT